MENIIHVGDKQTKQIWEDVEIQNVGEYHDLYVQSGTLLLTDKVESLWSKCIEINGIDSAYFFISTSISMACISEENRSRIGIFD